MLRRLGTSIVYMWQSHTRPNKVCSLYRRHSAGYLQIGDEGWLHPSAVIPWSKQTENTFLRTSVRDLSCRMKTPAPARRPGKAFVATPPAAPPFLPEPEPEPECGFAPPEGDSPADYRWVPVRRRPRRDGWTEEKQRRFIAVLPIPVWSASPPGKWG